MPTIAKVKIWDWLFGIYLAAMLPAQSIIIIIITNIIFKTDGQIVCESEGQPHANMTDELFFN